MVKVRERGVPRRGTRPRMAPGARGRTTSHHRTPNMVVETRARGRGANSAPRRGTSAAPPCQSGSGRLARPGGRKQALDKLVIYLPVERASQIRQLLSAAKGRVRLAVVGISILSPYTYRAPSGESGPPYVTNPTDYVTARGSVFSLAIRWRSSRLRVRPQTMRRRAELPLCPLAQSFAPGPRCWSMSVIVILRRSRLSSFRSAWPKSLRMASSMAAQSKMISRSSS